MKKIRLLTAIALVILLPAIVFGQNDAYKIEYRGYFFHHYKDSYIKRVAYDTIKCKCVVTIAQKDSVLVYEMKNSKCRGRIYKLKYKDKLFSFRIRKKELKATRKIRWRRPKGPQFPKLEAIIDTVNQRIEWKYDEANSAGMPSTERINFIFGAFSPKSEFKSSNKNRWEDFFNPTNGVWSEDKSTFTVFRKQERFPEYDNFDVISKLENPDDFWATSTQTNYKSLRVTGISSLSYTIKIQLRRVK